MQTRSLYFLQQQNCICFIKLVSHAMFRFCEDSMYFHIHAILHLCLLCKILNALLNTQSPVCHNINVSYVCGVMWWEVFLFYLFCDVLWIPLWLLDNIKTFLKMKKTKFKGIIKGGWNKESLPNEINIPCKATYFLNAIY